MALNVWNFVKVAAEMKKGFYAARRAYAWTAWRPYLLVWLLVYVVVVILCFAFSGGLRGRLGYGIDMT